MLLLSFTELELLVTGYAGESGSRILYQNDETRKKLLDIYPKSFFAVLGDNSGNCASSGGPAAELPEDVVELPAGAGELPAGAEDLESAAEGGVYGALWRLLHRNRLGASFSRRLIPVRQQTVELCEFLGLDPCRLAAESCTVWLVSDPSLLLRKAEEAGIPARVIGYTEKGPAIRRTDGEIVSYLRRPPELASACVEKP